jgi:hypothetical protein
MYYSDFTPYNLILQNNLTSLSQVINKGIFTDGNCLYYIRDQNIAINKRNMKNRIIMPLFPLEVVLFPDLPCPCIYLRNAIKL